MADHEDHEEGNEASPLERAAAIGPLPGVQAQDAMEERGEDHSDEGDADEKAEEAGRGDLAGGIAMDR